MSAVGPRQLSLLFSSNFLRVFLPFSVTSPSPPLKLSPSYTLGGGHVVFVFLSLFSQRRRIVTNFVEWLAVVLSPCFSRHTALLKRLFPLFSVVFGSFKRPYCFHIRVWNFQPMLDLRKTLNFPEPEGIGVNEYSYPDTIISFLNYRWTRCYVSAGSNLSDRLMKENIYIECHAYR